MNSLSFAIERFQILIFCTLTVLLSYASYFLPVRREALPSVFVLVPPVAALVLTYATEDEAGVRALLGQLARWRVGLKWVGGAVLLGLAMRLVVGVIALADGSSARRASARDVVDDGRVERGGGAGSHRHGCLVSFAETATAGSLRAGLLFAAIAMLLKTFWS